MGFLHLYFYILTGIFGFEISANSTEIPLKVDSDCYYVLDTGKPSHTAADYVSEAIETANRNRLEQPDPQFLSRADEEAIQRSGESLPTALRHFLEFDDSFGSPLRLSLLKTSDTNTEHPAVVGRKHPEKGGQLHVDFQWEVAPGETVDTSTTLYFNQPRPKSTPKTDKKYLIGPEHEVVVWHVHGGGSPSAVAMNASSKASYFEKKGIPLLAVDQPGHGKGTRVSQFTSYDHFISYNLQLIEKLVHPGVKIVFSGHSKGGMDSMYLYMDYLQRDTEEAAQWRERIIAIIPESPALDLTPGASDEERAKAEELLLEQMMEDLELQGRISEGDWDFLKNIMREEKSNPVSMWYNTVNFLFYKFSKQGSYSSSDLPELNIFMGVYDGLVMVGREAGWRFLEEQLNSDNLTLMDRMSVPKRSVAFPIGHQIHDARDPNGQQFVYDETLRTIMRRTETDFHTISELREIVDKQIRSEVQGRLTELERALVNVPRGITADIHGKLNALEELRQSNNDELNDPSEKRRNELLSFVGAYEAIEIEVSNYAEEILDVTINRYYESQRQKRLNSRTTFEHEQLEITIPPPTGIKNRIDAAKKLNSEKNEDRKTEIQEYIDAYDRAMAEADRFLNEFEEDEKKYYLDKLSSEAFLELKRAALNWFLSRLLNQTDEGMYTLLYEIFLQYSNNFAAREFFDSHVVYVTSRSEFGLNLKKEISELIAFFDSVEKLKKLKSAQKIERSLQLARDLNERFDVKGGMTQAEKELALDRSPERVSALRAYIPLAKDAEKRAEVEFVFETDEQVQSELEGFLHESKKGKTTLETFELAKSGELRRQKTKGNRNFQLPHEDFFETAKFLGYIEVGKNKLSKIIKNKEQMESDLFISSFTDILRMNGLDRESLEKLSEEARRVLCTSEQCSEDLRRQLQQFIDSFDVFTRVQIGEIENEGILNGLDDIQTFVDIIKNTGPEGTTPTYAKDRRRLIDNAIQKIKNVVTSFNRRASQAQIEYLEQIPNRPEGILSSKNAEQELAFDHSPQRQTLLNDYIRESKTAQERLMQKIEDEYQSKLALLERDYLPDDIGSLEDAEARLRRAQAMLEEEFVPVGDGSLEIKELVEEKQHLTEEVAKISKRLSVVNTGENNKEGLRDLKKKKDKILKGVNSLFEASKVTAGSETWPGNQYPEFWPLNIRTLVQEREEALERWKTTEVALNKAKSDHLLQRLQERGHLIPTDISEEPDHIKELIAEFAKLRKEYGALKKKIKSAFVQSVLMGQWTESGLPFAKMAKEQLEELLGDSESYNEAPNGLVYYSIEGNIQRLEDERKNLLALLSQKRRRFGEISHRYAALMEEHSTSGSPNIVYRIAVPDLLALDFDNLYAAITENTLEAAAKRRALREALATWDQIWKDVTADDQLLNPEWYPHSPFFLRLAN